jgi:hypothetical protein
VERVINHLTWPRLLLLAGALVVWAMLDVSIYSVLIATLVAYGLFKLGAVMLGGLARPVPEPPPPGELRRVKLMFRCSICGTEVRMTSANDQVPEPPRHCLEDMDLVTPVDDL